jgi:sigma-B regulation protein RsbU (phosphoserine phosphatase)
MVVGMMEGEAFKQTLSDETYSLEPGDVVLFYTDGVTEANDPEKDEFGMNRLVAAMRTVTKMSAQHAIDLIVHKLIRFVHDEPPYDDMSLVLVRVIPETDSQ